MKPTNPKVIALCGALSLCSAAHAATDERPNIIFILTDDQRYDLLGCTGHPLIKTPNIDNLAKEGVLFHNAHVSSPISNPSRTCILTGEFERSHGVNFNSGTALSEEAWNDTYPMVLRRSGYYTGYIGKNHTPVGKQGYETGIMDKSFDYWYAGHEHLGFYPKEKHKIFKGSNADTQVEIIAEGVMDFLNPNERNLAGAEHFLNNRPTDKPFYVSICFNLPHANGTSSMKLKPTDPELYRTGYRDLIDQIALPENYIAKADITQQKLPHSVFRPENRQPSYNYVDTPESLRERKVREMEAVTGIDILVGQLREKLKEQGVDKNTIIVFTSDHGIFNGEFGLGGKALSYEMCTRIPLIICDPRAPKSQQGIDNDELVLSIDYAKTFLDWAGVKSPKRYQGASLAPMLRGEAESVRNYLFTENLWSTSFGNPRSESVQNKEWKYIRYYKNENMPSNEVAKVMKEMNLTGKALYLLNMSDVVKYRRFVNSRLDSGEEPVYEELYNLKADPQEANNLIGAGQYAEILNTLRHECDAQLKYARGTNAPRVEIIVDDFTPEMMKKTPAKKKK